MTNGRTPRSSSSSSDEHTLSGLLTVLERADALPSAGRSRPRRAVLHTSAGARGQRLRQPARPVPAPRLRPTAQPVPVRATAPAPVMWRRDLADAPAPVAPPALPAPQPGLVRRLALWGAGPEGEHLAWNRPRPRTAPAPVSVPTVAGPPRPSLRAAAAGRLRRQVRRLALWGAGADGQHLAWNAPPPPRVYSARLPVRPASSGVVRLTALPSTPTIKPAASSPAAALSPALHLRAAGSLSRAAARPPRASQPRASELTGWPAVRPEPCPALPAPSGWPVREPGVRACARSPGRARTRGDPPACRVRGSPP
ncbi:hypothetical protein [Blastococcus sp. URHD0036]|uniref:hypothetical protein n=1 Tax=Blastococcus sp. URHD0036 TaxID=1380356 RepID=UPI0004951F67|nr:hypothetical protein [Blastococcus sp. URHD0036]